MIQISQIKFSNTTSSQPSDKSPTKNILQNQNWPTFTQNPHWNPPTDVFETEDKVIVRMEIAGMQEDDFNVIMKKNVLTISGTRRDYIDDIHVFHQMEIGFGEFFSAIEINMALNIETAEAQYENGYLFVRIDKAKPKSIKVENKQN